METTYTGGEMDWRIKEAKKQGIRMAIDNLKMHYCIIDTEARIKEIEEGQKEEK